MKMGLFSWDDDHFTIGLWDQELHDQIKARAAEAKAAFEASRNEPWRLAMPFLELAVLNDAKDGFRGCIVCAAKLNGPRIACPDHWRALSADNMIHANLELASMRASGK
jgi:hypothetical protein